MMDHYPQLGLQNALSFGHEFLDFLQISRVSLRTAFTCSDCNVRYLFDDYALDANRRELLRGTRQVSVEPQVFDLLLYLIRNRERVVGKDDILVSVWQGRIVSESALSTRINAARSVVGDSGEEQRLIKTPPRNRTSGRGCELRTIPLYFSIHQLDASISPWSEFTGYKFRERWITVPLPPPVLLRPTFSVGFWRAEIANNHGLRAQTSALRLGL